MNINMSEFRKKFMSNIKDHPIKSIRKNMFIESILFKKNGLKDKDKEIKIKLICKLIMIKYPHILYPGKNNNQMLKKYNLHYRKFYAGKNIIMDILLKSISPILYKSILTGLQNENCNNKIKNESKETVAAYRDEDLLKIYKKFVKSILTIIGTKNIELVFTEIYNYADISNYFSHMNNNRHQYAISNYYIELFT
ncbi:conserved Plasmodium protein, unknown function [Plasmodium chabaudi adami]|uniref:Uncharacterized protein n=1 Tax=Plasmodium chabaudi adami TaxID=5826 RepID=A0A1C6XEP8_PLACE|nr:conserved Plasmodium protein, unknown function [Plasmodium chabaudi adami]